MNDAIRTRPDGVTVETTDNLAGGLTVTYRDVEDVHAWKTIERVFDRTGEQREQAVEYDPGFEGFGYQVFGYDDSLSPGFELHSIHLYDDRDAHAADPGDWSELRLFGYDGDGRLVQDNRSYADGSHRNARIDAGTGQIAQIDWGDRGDAFAWDRRSDIYRDGSLVASDTRFDDGTGTSIVFENVSDGTEPLVRQTELRLYQDYATGEDWSELRLFGYDEEGRLTVDNRTYDNGVARYGKIDAQTGQVEQIGWFDTENAFAWKERYVFHEDGARKSVQTEMDDGRLIGMVFDTMTGDRLSVTHADAADAFLWATTETRYVDGVVRARSTVFDNGVERDVEYDASGALSVVRQRDTADAFDWAERTTLWLDGERVSVETVPDDTGAL